MERFMKLTHPESSNVIVVLKTHILLVEDLGDMRLVGLKGGDSVMCSESVDDILAEIDC